MNMLIRLIALLEGFSTLAIQIIALRQAIPVVGSSVVLTSVYIGVILLALSLGYRVGGMVAERHRHSRRHLAMILASYLLIAGVYYSIVTFGMHQGLLEQYLTLTDSYLGALFLVSLVIFAIPVFLASQTIPLLTELLPVTSKGQASGQILFASTVGSFLGSVLTSIVLFSVLGVAITSAVTVSIVLLAGLLAWTIVSRRRLIGLMILWIIVTLGLIVTASWSRTEVLYETDTAYHDVQIVPYMYQGRDVRLMVTNGGFSSAWDPETQTSPFPYLQELVDQTMRLEPMRILLIGTAGFTYPVQLQDQPWIERIDAIDIDGEFLEISEQHFLDHSIDQETIAFYPDSARYFLRQVIAKGAQYDLVVLDAYNGRYVPAELATAEFFEDIQRVCSDDCVVMSNLIVDYDLRSDFARSIVGAMQSVRPSLSISKLHSRPEGIGNSIVSTAGVDGYDQIDTLSGIVVPTDDRHQLEQELVQMWNKFN